MRKPIVYALMLLTTTLSAQTEKTTPFQVSFITPLGTNGMDSWETTNDVSINIIAGYAGGVSGFEAASFANVLKNDMDGAQIAGFSNVVLGDVKGAHVAGFANYVGGRVIEGAQISCFSNVTNGSSTVAQITGFANVIDGSLTGAQISGFSNTAIGDVTGSQIAGFANVAKGELNGSQIGGFTNVATSKIIGAQISGFANATTSDIEGSQISGFFNYAKVVKGVQIAGFMNYADSIEDGIPIAFISIVKNGYRRFEIGGNESFIGQISFKTGVESFYNIFSVAFSARNEAAMWAFGYGIGTGVKLDDKWGLNVEALAYHINEDESFTDHLNLLSKLEVKVSRKINDRLSVYAGPSFNVLVSALPDGEGGFREPAILPWSIFEKSYDDNRLFMYPGFTLGLAL